MAAAAARPRPPREALRQLLRAHPRVHPGSAAAAELCAFGLGGLPFMEWDEEASRPWGRLLESPGWRDPAPPAGSPGLALPTGVPEQGSPRSWPRREAEDPFGLAQQRLRPGQEGPGAVEQLDGEAEDPLRRPTLCQEEDAEEEDQAPGGAPQSAAQRPEEEQPPGASAGLLAEAEAEEAALLRELGALDRRLPAEVEGSAVTQPTPPPSGGGGAAPSPRPPPPLPRGPPAAPRGARQQRPPRPPPP